MAITFPAAPTNGQVYTDTTSGQSWTFDGVKWKGVSDANLWRKAGTTLSPAVATDTIQGPLVPTNGALGSRNVIINGMVNINQRGVTIAAAAVGAYGPDRWKKVDATNMTQIIEDVNVVPSAKYTLSWKGGTPQVLTAPATGHWTLPNIPITATEIQLELGEVATPFERRSYGQELALCQRYFESEVHYMVATAASGGNIGGTVPFAAKKRAAPTITHTLHTGNSVGIAGGTATTSTGRFSFYASVSASGEILFTWVATAEL
jgi:hypothetical protein